MLASMIKAAMMIHGEVGVGHPFDSSGYLIILSGPKRKPAFLCKSTSLGR